MPSYNFTDLYHDSTTVLGTFGDWDDNETLILSPSQGSRFSDVQVYEGYHLNYPQIIPANATITSIRVIAYSQTGFTNALLRCALSMNKKWDFAYALVQGVDNLGAHYIFDFAQDGLMQLFLNTNGGVAALNSYGFGCALFSFGPSSGVVEPDYMTVTNVRMEIDFTAPETRTGVASITQGAQTLNAAGSVALQGQGSGQQSQNLAAIGNVQMSPKVRFYSLSAVYDFSAAFNIILKRSI
jgi:hypothetical protein